MVDIDSIMELLDWNRTEEEQALGLKLAREVKCINVFLQPLTPAYNKNVWENCAILLSEKSDEELSGHLFQLMEWLQDLNWPGALCILNRLKKWEKDLMFEKTLNDCKKCARAMDDASWEAALQELG